jgi:hypothetical protein
LCPCTCHKGVWGSAGIVNSYISDKWICQLHALVALPPGRFSWYPLNWRLVGAESRCGHGRREKFVASVRNRSTVARLPASVVLPQISNTRHSKNTITFIREVLGSNFGCVTDMFFVAFISHCRNVYCIVPQTRARLVLPASFPILYLQIMLPFHALSCATDRSLNNP